MAQVSDLQTSFTGGEFSTAYQGRADDPRYKTGLNRCRNYLIMEEGSLTRRPGFQFKSTTRGGKPGRIMPWLFDSTVPMLSEFTDSFMRFYQNGVLELGDTAGVASVSTDNPAIVTMSLPFASTWFTGDTVVFTEASRPPGGSQFAPALLGRQMTIAITGINTCTLADAITGTPIDGTAFTQPFVSASLVKVVEIATPYVNESWKSLRKVQSGEIVDNQFVQKVTFLNGTTRPQSLSSAQNVSLGLIPEQFIDGPYLDPPTNPVPATPTGTSGKIVLQFYAFDFTTVYNRGDIVRDPNTEVFYQSIRDANVGNALNVALGYWVLAPFAWNGSIFMTGSVVTDNGNLYFSQIDYNSFNDPILGSPVWAVGSTYALHDVVSWNADWAGGTTYAAGDLVLFTTDGQIYVSLQSGNVGHSPSTAVAWWAVASTPANTPWVATTTYAAGGAVVVTYKGTYYESQQAANTGNYPDISPAYWRPLVLGLPNYWQSLVGTNIGHQPDTSPSQWAAIPFPWSLMPPAWSSLITYSIGASVVFDEIVYVQIVSSTNKEPDTNIGFWQPIVWKLPPTTIGDFNGIDGFQTTDDGRLIRLLSGPQDWFSTVSYSTGQTVSYIVNVYTSAVDSNLGNEPDISPAFWTIETTTSDVWTWAEISVAGPDSTLDISTWSPQSYPQGAIVSWGFGTLAGGFPSGAYINLIAGNLSQPSNDGTALNANNWLKIADFTSNGDFRLSFLPNTGTFAGIVHLPFTGWNSGQVYQLGDIVSSGGYFVSLINGNLDTPGASANWLPVDSPTATAAGSNFDVPVVIMGNALPNTNPIFLWQLGLYSDTTGWPTCATYHEGRLWFGGVFANRFDAGMSNGGFNFAPTGTDGTVADDNAIAYVLNADDSCQVEWFNVQPTNLLVGTLTGEWTISASQLDDPITPTSIQARRATKFGCFDAEASHLPTATAFIHGLQRKIIEYKNFIDTSAYSVQPMGINLSQTSSHLTGGFIEEIAYQFERLPIIWARNGDGSLFGLGYKRGPDQQYYGAQSVSMGTGRLVESVAVQAGAGGVKQNLWAVTTDVMDDSGIRWIETMADVFEDGSTPQDALFLDGATFPVNAVLNSGETQVVLYGLQNLIGETVVAFGQGTGVQCPVTAVVAADGSLTLPLDPATGFDATGISVINPDTSVTITVAVGKTYASQGQRLRAVEGSQNGPAFAKTRRNARAGVYVFLTHSLSIGTDFGATLHPLKLVLDPNGNIVPPGPTDLVTGIYREASDSGYNFDAMLSWQQDDAYPGAVLAVGSFFDPADA